MKEKIKILHYGKCTIIYVTYNEKKIVDIWHIRNKQRIIMSVTGLYSLIKTFGIESEISETLKELLQAYKIAEEV